LVKSKIKKVPFCTKISKKTHKRFIKFVKKNHHMVVKGGFSLETERAILVLLEMYDV
jgi:hypothetical protein